MDIHVQGKDKNSTLIVPESEEASYRIIPAEGSAATVVFLLTETVRLNVTCFIDRPHVAITVIGVALPARPSSIRVHTLQHHGAPDSVSDLLMVSLTGDGGLFDYQGEIRIDPGAQRSNAYQRNDNLLLGKDARVTTKPVLEIQANDVRCTHGATTGGMDEEALWYLSARGIGKREGSALLAHGFISRIFDKTDDVRVRKRVLGAADIAFRETVL